MRLSSVLAALLFNVFVFLFVLAIWAEMGPYERLVRIAVALGAPDDWTHFHLLTLWAFLVPAILLARPDRKHSLTELVLLYGPSAVGVAVTFVFTCYFLLIGDGTPGEVSFADAVRSASYLPRAVVVETKDLPALQGDRAARIQGRRASSPEIFYTPFDQGAWPEPHTPVVLKTQGIWGDRVLFDDRFRATISFEPLPYRVRCQFPKDQNAFVIVLSHRTSIRERWMVLGVVYGVGLMSIVITALVRKRAAGVAKGLSNDGIE